MQNHYNYVFDKITSTYNFVTKNNILYRVAFLVDNTFSSISGEDISNVFQLVIEKASDELEPFDAKVSKTIENIIEGFFKKTENSLVFICSDEKQKAKVRHAIFERWYNNSKHKEVIVKIDNEIKFHASNIEIEVLYTSFMFHVKNPNFERLIKIYSQIEKILNEEK
ncbi:DUF6169 family protein [Belliella sp. DSM 107340]|uniref:DUF6169 family protein n=1 Tax=Belliella calami TaxID=2923436 RepID=A0ABS9UJC4_9BACT|nr:DUF6169 family protein [Belliella calami]MCH7396525.1 DUF6169 family protein [Belliella calami]